MGDRFPIWNLLPTSFVGDSHLFLEPLGCLCEPIDGLARGLANAAALHAVQDSAVLSPITTLIAAAIHSSQRLFWPSPALPCDHLEKLPTSSEWLLLAALASARSHLPTNVGAAIDAIAGSLALNPRLARDLACTSDDPPIDYGMGLLLSAITGQAEFVFAGRALGRLTRLLAEVFAILEPRFVAPQPLLLGRVAADVGLGSRAAQAIACAAKPSPDKLPLIRLLGHAHIRDRMLEITSEWLKNASALAEPTMQPLYALAHHASDTITSKVTGARIFGLLPAHYPPASEVDRTIALAHAALASDTELRSTWEVQRWGDWCAEPRLGKVFPVGLCLLTLHRMGHDLSTRIERMIRDTRRADGWRYYENWTDIPPDIDDLGLILRLSATITDPPMHPEIFHRPLELVRQAIAKDALVPVWLYDGLDEPVSKQAPNWLGPRCIAVAAQFLLGLLEAHIDGYEDVKIRVLEWIVESWEKEQERAVYHYTWPFARVLVVKLARASESFAPAVLQSRLLSMVTAIADSIQQSVESDGGWTTPMATSCHLAILALDGRVFDPWPGLTYLAARQRQDGLWPAEPLYRCPGKDGNATAHGAAELTTAVCLDALLDVKAYLQRAS